MTPRPRRRGGGRRRRRPLLALTAADAGSRVAMVLRKPLSESSSFWAQGGLAAAIGDGRLAGAARRGHRRGGAWHLQALGGRAAGAGGPGSGLELERRGVEFDRDRDGRLSLALEGGHSRRRVVHAGGAGTGRRITERLAELAAGDERIEVNEETSAVALWSDGERCHGVITDPGPCGRRRRSSPPAARPLSGRAPQTRGGPSEPVR